MMLSLNEIKSRALAFSSEHAQDSSERAEAQTFWNDFFNVFGISRRRVASFEKPVRRSGHSGGFVDLLWKGTLLIEHKSEGENLDKAYSQALDYFEGLKENELPRFVLVCDFKNFKLYDLDEGKNYFFTLAEFVNNINLFGFISGYRQKKFDNEDQVNIQAAEQMGCLYDMLKLDGYGGHALKVMLVRLLFCLFAEDTGIFESGLFREYIETRTNEDGSDLGYHLAALFQILNTPLEQRQKSLDMQLASFPYVDGHLFEETIAMASFNSEMRKTLLNSCLLDWSKISPSIFGSLFQSVMDSDARRNLGAHYTREENILKTLNPLFLDKLHDELKKIKIQNNPNRKNKLEKFISKLSNIRIMDPACGCGNFLVLAYRELRRLELEALLAIHQTTEGFKVHLNFSGAKSFSKVDVDQFTGIEIEEFPAQIARVALWLTDHQMNMELSKSFGDYYARLPLEKSANIIIGDAIDIDWETVGKAETLSYIVGNPPFKGKKEQSNENKEDMRKAFSGFPKYGNLDYVACWHRKAAQLMKKYPCISSAFVSTNSICQGEQTPIFWRILNESNIKLQFCHRTFQWSNEAKGGAAVHCIILGMSKDDLFPKTIFDYETPKSFPTAINAKNINIYLIDYEDVVVLPREKPLQKDTPKIIYGNMPIDKGYLVIEKEDYYKFIKEDKNNKKFLKLYWGGNEFLYNLERYCIWLKDIPSSEYKNSKLIMERIKKTKEFREKSKREQTNKLAKTPFLFGEIRQPKKSQYLLIPKVSSELRRYIPIGFCSPEIIASGSAMIVPDADEYHFGILSSSMHMVWMRYIAGRLESRYQYSTTLVYNTFPWPENLTSSKKDRIITKAKNVLAIRRKYHSSTMADLYDINLMPKDLVKAHNDLDRVVESTYGIKAHSTDMDKMKVLFRLYLANK